MFIIRLITWLCWALILAWIGISAWVGFEERPGEAITMLVIFVLIVTLAVIAIPHAKDYKR